MAKVIVIDDMKEIHLKLTHKELIVIQLALKEYRPGFFINEQNKYLNYINNKLFDIDEFKSINQIDKKKTKILFKIKNKLKKIIVW